MKLDELDPELFTWDSYEYDFGNRLDCFWNQYPEIYQFDEFLSKLKNKIVGWCNPSRLSVRPRNDGIAVMCEDEDGRFWFHVLDKTANALGIKREFSA